VPVPIDVLMEVVNTLLIVGNPQGILGQQLRHERITQST
jgi:hypothetical protein